MLYRRYPVQALVNELGLETRVVIDVPSMVYVFGFALKGIKPEQLKRLDMRVNGLLVIELAGFWSDEHERQVSAGEQIVMHHDLMGSNVEGGGMILMLGNVNQMWNTLRIDGLELHNANLTAHIKGDKSKPAQRFICEFLVSEMMRNGVGS